MATGSFVVTRTVPLLATVLLASCMSSIDSATFATHDPRPEGFEVRVFRDDLPACAYEEIGLVTWDPQHRWESLEDGMSSMKRRVRQMGGDAIVEFAYGEHAAGTATMISADSTTVKSSTRVFSERFASGTVVRYLDGDCGR